MNYGDETKYKTTRPPYDVIRIGDIVERYKGADRETVIYKDGKVQLLDENSESYPMLKIERVYATVATTEES